MMPSSVATDEVGHVFCLMSHDVDQYWDRFAHHLKRFCRETDEATVKGLRDDLRAARKQFWGFDDGTQITVVCLTAIEGTLCLLWACCGTETGPRQIERGLEEISRWAKDIGCSRLKIRGRPGWERRLKGFKRVAVILETTL